MSFIDTSNFKHTIFVPLACAFENDPRVTQEVSSFLKSGFIVNVLSWDREGIFKSYAKSFLDVKYVKLLKSISFSRMIFLLSAFLFQQRIFIEGVKLIRKKNRILIHCNDFNTLPGSVLLKILFKNKVKIIYDSHEYTPGVYEEFYGKTVSKFVVRIEEILIKYVDTIIGATPPTSAYLESISKKKIDTIFNYPSQELIPTINKQQARKDLNLGSETFILCFVGSLRLDVALTELLEAVELVRLHKPKIRFQVIIAGDGPLRKKIVNYIDEKELEEYVKVLGRVSRKKALTYLRASDASYAVYKAKGKNSQIGLSWKLFESIACDTHPIVMDNTVASSFLKKKNIGFVVSSLNPVHIARTLENVIENEALDFSISSSKKNYTWENQEKIFLRNYKY